MGSFLIYSILMGFSADDDDSQDFNFEIVEVTKCDRSSDCMSYEHCNNKNQCVDTSKEPCTSSADCVAGEQCDFNTTPHPCKP